MIKLTTAGESHGKGLFAILEGIPAGLCIDINELNSELRRRQQGYGRGGRQKIEHDEIELLAGVRNLVTLGSPIALAVWNRDYETWKPFMAPEGCDAEGRTLTRVRPGHADLAGMTKFRQRDARNVLERASARETAARVAAGTIARQLLRALGIRIKGYVRRVGDVVDEREYAFGEIDPSPVLGMADREKEALACALIDSCRREGDTLGGEIELRVKGLKSGFGSCMTYAEKLDARLVSALMSVQAVKGAEVGVGFTAAQRRGSAVHDEIFVQDGEIHRKTNRAGGIEGGMSNGEELVLRAAMKPIPTLMKGLATVDLATMQPAVAAPERSDVCAVSACAVVLESVIALELAKAVSQRLGGDHMDELIARYGELS